jgi:hypothetical protein
MATSPGIILAGAGIVAANEWYQKNTLNWRVLAAGGLLALFMDGAEKVSAPLAIGLSSIMVVTVLVTPLSGTGSSPLQTVSGIVNTPAKKA